MISKIHNFFLTYGSDLYQDKKLWTTNGIKIVMK